MREVTLNAHQLKILLSWAGYQCVGLSPEEFSNLLDLKIEDLLNNPPPRVIQ